MMDKGEILDEAERLTYQDYFHKLLTLWDDGWYHLAEKAGNESI
jgi:hypothetical protein